jgi:hypothetical protein
MLLLLLAALLALLAAPACSLEGQGLARDSGAPGRASQATRLRGAAATGGSELSLASAASPSGNRMAPRRLAAGGSDAATFAHAPAAGD